MGSRQGLSAGVCVVQVARGVSGESDVAAGWQIGSTVAEEGITAWHARSRGSCARVGMVLQRSQWVDVGLGSGREVLDEVGMLSADWVAADWQAIN